MIKLSRGHRKSLLKIDGLEVNVTRKSMKYIRLKVLPPVGEVVVSAPHRVSNGEITTMVRERLAWVHQQRAAFQRLAGIEAPRYQTGESHRLWGEDYQLRLEFTRAPRSTRITTSRDIILYCRESDSVAQRAHQLESFYRHQLQMALDPLLERWQQRVDRRVSYLGIRRMKTRWGSCNMQRARIWINLDLARHPLPCLEYVLVHELVHLFEPGHGERFKALMDKFLPGWRHSHNYLRQN